MYSFISKYLYLKLLQNINLSRLLTYFKIFCVKLNVCRRYDKRRRECLFALLIEID